MWTLVCFVTGFVLVFWLCTFCSLAIVGQRSVPMREPHSRPVAVVFATIFVTDVWGLYLRNVFAVDEMCLGSAC